MPQYRRITLAPPPPITPEPTFMERLKGLGPTAIRLGSGLVGSIPAMVPGIGTAAGAMIGGAGEALAQRVEGGDPFSGKGAARVGVEAGLTAMPLGKVYQGGRMLLSALRGGALAGTGTLGRQWAEGRDFDAGEAAIPTALGAVTGGIFGKMLPGPMKPPSKVPITIQPTVRQGGMTPRPITPSGEPVNLQQRGPIPSTERIGAYGGGFTPSMSQTRMIAAEEKAVEQATTAEEIALRKKREGLVPGRPSVSESISAKIPGGTERSTIRYAPPKEGAERGVGGLGAMLGVEAAEDALPVIAKTDVIAPASDKLAKLAETTNGVKALEDLEQKLGMEIATPLGGRGTMPALPPPAAVPSFINQPPPGQPVSPMARFFKSPMDALGGKDPITGEITNPFGYAATQAAEKAGELPKKAIGGYASAARLLGAGLGREAAAAESTVGKGLGSPLGAAPLGGAAVTPQAPSTALPLPTTVQYPKIGGVKATPDLEAFFQRMRGQGSGPGSPIGPSRGGGSSWGGSETGQIDPELLTTLGLTAGGGLVGAAIDDDDPMRGLVIGMHAGFLPAGVRVMMQTPQGIQNLRTKLSTEGGVRETATRIVETMPEIQRFNYLADDVGLPANAVVGPYSAGVLGAVERGLSGDSRGWVALKEMSPDKLIPTFQGAFQQAKDIIGRSEGKALSSAVTPLDALLASPGAVMTTGDVVIREALMRGGFSEAEARVMTHTSEPASQLGAGLVNLVRSGGTLAKIAAPFVKTPVNLMEQGAQRLPVAGGLYQLLKANPTAMREVLAQQGMSAGLSAGAYGLGNTLDPDTARTARRYVTNAAGRYSLPVGMAFAAGQAEKQGRPVAPQLLRSIQQSIPLPTTDTVEDFGRFITGGFNMKDAPRALVPGYLSDFVPTPLAPLSIARFRPR